jgi:tRNA threonylcarbamoyladenosine biosynthesis protein TsaE
MSTFTSNRYEDTIEYGKSLGQTLAGGELIILTGQLGSGKTVLTKGIAESLGINEVVTSPSFAIMNLYEGRVKLCHFDFYRIEKKTEMEDLLEDFVYGSNCICVVEWGDPLIDRFESYIHIHIIIDKDSRILTEKRPNTHGEVHMKMGGAT